MKSLKRTTRVDMQVSLLTAIIVVVSSTSIFLLNFVMSYSDMIKTLQNRVYGIYTFVEERLDKDCFRYLDSYEDMKSDLYLRAKDMLESMRIGTDVRYLYTATLNSDGEYIYQVDGLPSDSQDFRNVGDAIEQEIIPYIERAYKGEIVLPKDIEGTSWGYIFISYFPIHDGDEVIGVIGVEFDAEHQYKTYRLLKIFTPIIIVLFCLISSFVATVLFRRISNPTYRDFANTDMLTGLANRNAFDVMITNLNSSIENLKVSIIIIDFDGLKNINDTLGHAAGDQYIQSGSEIIQRNITKPDVLFRVGGDEFSAILMGKTENEAKELIKIIQQETELHNQNAELKVKMSLGCAEFDRRTDKELMDTYRRADKAMYEEKMKKKCIINIIK